MPFIPKYSSVLPFLFHLETQRMSFSLCCMLVLASQLNLARSTQVRSSVSHFTQLSLLGQRGGSGEWSWKYREEIQHSHEVMHGPCNFQVILICVPFHVTQNDGFPPFTWINSSLPRAKVTMVLCCWGEPALALNTCLENPNRKSLEYPIISQSTAQADKRTWLILK